MTWFTDFWTYLYKDVYKENDFKFMVLGTSRFTGIVFYGLCAFLMFVDLKGKPQWMLKYKVQPGVNQPVTGQKLWKAVRVVMFNHLCISFPFLCCIYYLQKYVGCSCRPEDLPSNLTVIRDLVCILILEEIGFYYTHRFAHWGPMYRHIHKKHHEWTAPMGIICVYCHPVEHILSNLLPVTMGPVIMRSHMYTIVLWYTIAVSGTIIQHSGYHLPLLPSPEFHDYHHLKFNWNYGALGLMDWLHGTDKQFRTAPQYKRHQVLHGLRPMNTLFPDKKRDDSNDKVQQCAKPNK